MPYGVHGICQPDAIRFRTELNTALSTENCNGTIKYTQGTFNFYSKVNVTRGINDIDTMFIELVLGTSQ